MMVSSAGEWGEMWPDTAPGAIRADDKVKAGQRSGVVEVQGVRWRSGLQFAIRR